MTQSRTMSLVESATNVIVGYILAILTQLAVFPMFGIEAAIHEHLAIGLVFLRGVLGSKRPAEAAVREAAVTPGLLAPALA